MQGSSLPRRVRAGRSGHPASWIDLHRGALGPSLDAFRLRSAWLLDTRDRGLALEAELAFGRALIQVGDLEGSAAAL